MEFYNAKITDYQVSEDKTVLGFASSINRLSEQPLDLNNYLVKNPNSTFFMKVKGESMSEYRIYDGDILVVDRASAIKSGMIILGILNREFVVKKIFFQENPLSIKLYSNNNSETQITDSDQFEIWGQILYTIHKHD